MSKTTVNILSVINKSSKITKEIINNKEHYIIRDVVPVIDDVVMNNGLYPKDEIDKSYKSINGNLMPIGHPNIMVNSYRQVMQKRLMNIMVVHGLKTYVKSKIKFCLIVMLILNLHEITKRANSF